MNNSKEFLILCYKGTKTEEKNNNNDTAHLQTGENLLLFLLAYNFTFIFNFSFYLDYIAILCPWMMG